MDKLRLLLIQPDLAWEDKAENLACISALIEKRTQDADIIVLPEMFSTGFSMRPVELAEGMTGKTIQWMKEKAQSTNSLLTGSLIIEENGLYYNRFLAYSPQGLVAQYDKRHLFRMSGEESSYQSGDQRIVFEWKGWRILPQICYDLRFPVWIRNQNDYDLALFVANWPAPRRDVWRSLLIARAIENQAYVAGANRVGMDNKKINHIGDSLIIHPKGNIIQEIDSEQHGLLESSISLNELSSFIKKFPAQLDRDEFHIT